MSQYCVLAPGRMFHAAYHETEYGFPVTDDRVLFERMCLEIFQAGLSWDLILKRRHGLNQAFDEFDLRSVAAYGEEDVLRLLEDERIIRNRRKVSAIIENARRIVSFMETGSSFSQWIAQSHPRRGQDWTKLFRENFKFMGGEIVGEFLMSIGYLPHAHDIGCPVYNRLLGILPPWLQAVKGGFVYDEAVYEKDE